MVRALRYFGRELVVYRTDGGALHILDAHCAHLGAHIGHGGKVNGDCVECPFHGWGWGPDGVNRYIPYEPQPNPSRRLRSWPVIEHHECIFMWHDPEGGPPRWELPSVFDAWPDLPAHAADYYRAYPELSVKYEREPVHPQITLENAPDTVHFRYVHGATVTPVLLDWEVAEHEYRTRAGWPVAGRETDARMALVIRTINPGVGGALSVFEGRDHYRLVFFTTPVEDGWSDLFYSIWWPRDPGDGDIAVPEHHRQRAENEFLHTLSDDLEIWRYQVYVENPALAKQDARPYGALRKWARQFYEVPVTA
jgi:3-ketosteroid 9alpha-monooxygenase subunit A